MGKKIKYRQGNPVVLPDEATAEKYDKIAKKLLEHCRKEAGYGFQVQSAMSILVGEIAKLQGRVEHLENISRIRLVRGGRTD